MLWFVDSDSREWGIKNEEPECVHIIQNFLYVKGDYLAILI